MCGIAVWCRVGQSQYGDRLRLEAGRAVYEIGSGQYAFKVLANFE